MLGQRAACAAVPATDLAHDDGRSNRVLGSPVGRVDDGIPEEREEGRRFDRQMGDEALDGWNGGSRAGEQVQRLFEQPAAGNGEPVRGHLAGRVAIAQRERLLETMLDAGRNRAAGMIELEQPAPAQQMRETCLMIGVHEAAVRRPAISSEHAREVLAEDRGGIDKAAAGPNRVDRGVGGGECPEPMQGARHFPARLVWTHDRTAADLGTQRVVGRGGARRRARTDMDQGAARHAQAKPIAEERDDVRERQAQAFVQDHDERRGLGADLHRCRAERVRGLQRMAALNAAATRRTRAHMDAKLADDGTDDWQIFLILRDDVRVVHLAATRGTRCGQGGIVSRIDMGRHGPRPVAPVRCAWTPARRTAGTLAMGFGERRGLPEASPAGRIELILESLVASLQPIALALGAGQRVAQPRNLLLLSLDQRVAIIRRRRRVHITHTLVMPEGGNLYKYKILDPRRSCGGTR